MNKPRVCFLYDVKGWAFYNKSANIKKYLSKYYDIDIIKYNTIKNDNNYDVIVSYSSFTLTKLRTSKKVICGISSKFNSMNTVNGYTYSFSNDYRTYEQLKGKNKYYLPNGVDTEFFKSEKERIIDKKEIKIGLVGSTLRSKHKGIDRINTICKNLNKMGYNVVNKSLFVDPNKKMKSREDMVKYYDGIDIFIVSSVSENTPNPLLEAMSMGIPCISNDVGMASLLLDNKKTGFLINSYNDINSYTKHIENLINDNNLYIKISKKSRNKIEEYDWSKMAMKYKEMIDDFLNIKKDSEIDKIPLKRRNGYFESYRKSITKERGE